MNWFDLLQALLLVGIVLPLLLRFLRLMSATTSLWILTAALTLSTVWYFLRGQDDNTFMNAAMTFVVLMLLHKDSRDRAENSDVDGDRDDVDGATTTKALSKS